MMDDVLVRLPDELIQTREAARTLACYVIAPVRKQRDGHIGLQPTGDGFGTPSFEDGGRVALHGDHLVREPDIDEPITTLRAAAALVGVDLVADPGVGADLPPFEPDAALAIDAGASLALGAWYAFADGALRNQRDELLTRGGTASMPTLWPEHFDLACDWGLDSKDRVNLGGSPGDAFHAEPYLYVGPWDVERITEDQIWNAPFGAVLPYSDLLGNGDPAATAHSFFSKVLEHLRL